jgi:hypothetical protein
MSKRQRSNKEPKKPKQAKPPAPAALSPIRSSAVEAAVASLRNGRKA